MKKLSKKRWILSILCLVITTICVVGFLWIVPFTPENAIRLYLLKSMKPIAAFRIYVKPADFSSGSEELYFITAGDYVPRLSVTYHEMRYWVVRKSKFGYSAEWDSGPGN